MTTEANQVNITYDEWDEKFRPMSNPWEPHSQQFDIDMDFSNIDVHRIWTMVDCDGHLYVVNGKHYVNRMWYFITEERWKDGDQYDIIDTDFCDCEHDPDEDCMNCMECGKCCEDVNDDDICPDCLQQMKVETQLCM
jgi:hypothetical protein